MSDEPAEPRSGPSTLRRCLSCLLLAILCPAVVAVYLTVTHVPDPPTLPRAESGALSGIRLVPAFAPLAFDRPVFLTAAPGDSESIYVVEQGGVIRRFPETGPWSNVAEVFVDLSDRVSRLHDEEGLLGLAFHADFAANGRLFVYYSREGGGPVLGGESVVAELTVTDGKLVRERVLLEVEQPYGNHNGGTLVFGPDGMLYIAFGDGGLYGDPKDNALDKSTLLGSILRIDVSETDGDLGYAIPDDNPFVAEEGACGEIWAYGLRNPWRIAFDRETGELWCADVGQACWEEVDVIVRGGNYGWGAYEGFSVYEAERLPLATDGIAPLAAYGRGEGKSITGGTVYRGSAVPKLVGWYIYADYVSGGLWALQRGARQEEAPGPVAKRHPTGEGVLVVKLSSDFPKGISSFGEGPSGELYACELGGRIFRFAR